MEKYWFKTNEKGINTPSTWHGWALYLGYLVCILILKNFISTSIIFLIVIFALGYGVSYLMKKKTAPPDYMFDYKTDGIPLTKLQVVLVVLGFIAFFFGSIWVAELLRQ